MLFLLILPLMLINQGALRRDVGLPGQPSPWASDDASHAPSAPAAVPTSPGPPDRLDWPQGLAVNPCRRPGNFADDPEVHVLLLFVTLLVQTVFIILFVFPLPTFLLQALFL